MLSFLSLVFKWISSGPLDRILDTIDRKVENETHREKLRTDIIKAHMTTRAAWLKAGGIKTLLLFAIPTALHYSAIVFYSLLVCKTCIYGPVDWNIAALPEPMDQWEGWIIMASIGGLSLLGMRR